MKNRSHQNRRRQFRLRSFGVAFCLLSALTVAGVAQNNFQQTNANKEYLGPVGDSIKPYRPAGRDPFKKVVKPKPRPGGGTAKAPKPLGFPSLEERRAKFRQLADDSGARGLPEPSPVMQYLVSELEVTGIFRDGNGYGAFIRATPTGTTFFVRRGARCYNGEVLRIESATFGTGSRVTFRQEAFVDVNGKQVRQENTVTKSPGTAAR